MGLFDGLFGGQTETVLAPQQSTTTTNLPDYVEEGSKNVINAALQLSDQPYQPFEGPRVAALTGPQQEAFGMAQDASLGGNMYRNVMGGALSGGMTRWTGDGVSESYMNPYMQDVIGIADRELTRQHGVEQVQRDAAAAEAGAFGGARHGIVDAEADRNLLQQRSDLYQTGLSKAYQTGADIFANDQERMYDMGRLGSRLADDEYTRLVSAGGALQNQTQRNYDAAYSDFNEQRMWPYEQLNFAMGALSGTPYSTTQTSSGTAGQVVQQPSVLGQLAGAGLALSSFF